jgi:hypothetical protein
MCSTTTGAFLGWAIGTADCDGVIALEYFDEDGVTAGTTLPAGWKPCVQGEDGPSWTPVHSTLAYAASIDIDFAGSEYNTITLTGGLGLTGSNYAAATEIVVHIVGDGSSNALSFPAAWVFVSTKPTTIAANKVGILRLICFGATAADVVASWEVQA